MLFFAFLIRRQLWELFKICLSFNFFIRLLLFSICFYMLFSICFYMFDLALVWFLGNIVLFDVFTLKFLTVEDLFRTLINIIFFFGLFLNRFLLDHLVECAILTLWNFLHFSACFLILFETFGNYILSISGEK